MSEIFANVSAALADRYVLERELGHGGMATVYLALDLKLQRKVAIKVLRPELAASLGNDRFLREIEIAARLSHPHILPLHDSGEAGGHLYYAMPYVEGESLRQKLEREGQLPIEEVIAIARAVASALSHAHRQGVVHRDIKPENILLARGNDGLAAHALVADFGIARALDAAGGERLTETGLALGTPAYMSPEQASSDGRLDGRSDIYALGCVTYEMIAGEPPFTGPTAQAIMARHAVDPAPPLHTVRATVPPSVEYAIERALAKVPADRYSTTTEFAEALTTEKGPSQRAWRSVSRRVGVGLALAIGTATAGIGAMVLRGSSLPAVVPSAATMAILPFVAAGSDTALAQLGRDLAVTLSATLDGIGDIETADRLTVANATAGRGSLSPAESAALARRLGSSSFLRGTLVRAGDNVRLDLGLYSTDGLAPLAEGITVIAHRDSIGTLTDSASWALLRQVWQRGEPPSPSLSAVTTRSLPALRAFLDGERELGANRWDKAALAFRSAIAADSTLWLAYFRYALTQWWGQQTPEPPIQEALRTRRQNLPERERLLVDAFLTSETTPQLRIDRFGAATERFPDYWPGWFLYADALYHFGPIVGHDWSVGLKAFRRVVALNPKLVPAWEHISNLALGRDQAVVSEAQARLAELGWPPRQNRMASLTSALHPGVSRAGGVIPPSLSAVADSLAEYMVSAEDEDFAFIYGPLGTLQQGFPAAQIDLNQRALKVNGVSARLAGTLKVANAWAWVARGQWDSGLTIIAEVTRPDSVTHGGALLATESYGMAVLGAWLGVTSPTVADQRRPIAVSILGQLEDEESRHFGRVRVAWLDGILGFARGDRSAIKRARINVGKGKRHQADLVDRSLAAFDRALAGDRKNAGRELADLEEYCIVQEGCGSMVPHIAIQRLAAGQWLREAGELEQASRLLRWQDAPWIGRPWTVGDALGGPTYLARAQIEESRGNQRLAREYYQQFLRRYDRPMPSQAHLVQEAKAALARLSAQGEPTTTRQ
jgi:tRNA A-37 threonylcarbamoyl transferase component Bud32/tetratricopeptide (TPR) repeat protein/TolB-like protein